MRFGLVVGFGEVFFKFLGPLTSLRAEYKKPIFWDNFFLGPPFATQILTWSPPKLKMTFFNFFLQILFYNIPIHNNNTQDKFQVHFCDFHYALLHPPPKSPFLGSQQAECVRYGQVSTPLGAGILSVGNHPSVQPDINHLYLISFISSNRVNTKLISCVWPSFTIIKIKTNICKGKQSIFLIFWGYIIWYHIGNSEEISSEAQSAKLVSPFFSPVSQKDYLQNTVDPTLNIKSNLQNTFCFCHPLKHLIK